MRPASAGRLAVASGARTPSARIFASLEIILRHAALFVIICILAMC